MPGVGLGAVAPGDDAAGDQLRHVEDHQRQDEQRHLGGAEQHRGHRGAGGQRLLRAAELDGDLVAAPETEPAGQPPRDGQHDRQHGEQHRQQPDDVERADRVPDALVDAVAEGAVDDADDAELVDELQPRVRGDETGRPAPGELAQDERQQQLHAQVEDRTGFDDQAAGAHDDHGQQRGEEDAEDVRQRGRDDRPGHVAAGDRGEVDGALHRGRQDRQPQHAQVQLGAQVVPRQGAQGERDEREDDVGEDQDRHVQTPVGQTGQRLTGGQPHAVQVEQDEDQHLDGPVQHVIDLAGRRQQAGDDGGDDDGHHEPVDADPPVPGPVLVRWGLGRCHAVSLGSDDQGDHGCPPPVPTTLAPWQSSSRSPTPPTSASATTYGCATSHCADPLRPPTACSSPRARR